MAEEKVAEQKKMITEIFCKGLVKGWNICGVGREIRTC